MLIGREVIARALGLSPRHVARLIRAGKLRPVQVPGIGLIYAPAAFVRSIQRAGMELASERVPTPAPATRDGRVGEGGSGVVQGGSAVGLGSPGDKKETPKREQVVEIKVKKGSGPKRVIRVRQPGVGPKGGKRRGMRHEVVEEILNG